MTGTVHEINIYFYHISLSSSCNEKCFRQICRENQNTFYSQYFFAERRAVYEIMWKNVVEPGRLQITKWRMRIAGWIHKATNIHSEYVILIAFPLQLWLHECALMLCCVIN
jgi:hypothetical protein